MTRFYVEKADGEPRVPISELVANALLKNNAAFQIIAQKGLVILRLTPGFRDQFNRTWCGGGARIV